MSDELALQHEDDDDRRTFGPSAANREILDSLVASGHFRTAIGAFQSAAMLALRHGLNPDDAPSSSGTMWNRGSVNPQVLEFLGWYLPTSTPVRALAQYGNVGVAYLAEKVEAEGYSISEIFELGSPDID